MTIQVERASAACLHPVEVVMKRLGVGRSMVFDLLASGQLRSVKVGRRRLVSEAALIEFIARLDSGGDNSIPRDEPDYAEAPARGRLLVEQAAPNAPPQRSSATC